ncbi:MAG: RnfH family protein [Rhodoferax sp.]
MATDLPIRIEMVYSPRAREVREQTLHLPPGTTLGAALQASGVLAALTPWEVDALECGIWGRKAALTQVLRANDRVELYRALLVDPTVARRERFVRQGAKSAGLFAKRRAGAKAGY